MSINKTTNHSNDKTLNKKGSDNESNSFKENLPLAIESLAELKQATRHVFSQAKQKIQLYTHNLDPRVLNNREIESVCLNFIRLSRYVKIEILITDEKYLYGLDHRLVSLYQKYTSFITIKIIPKDFHKNHFGFYIVDNRQLIYRKLAERFEAELHSFPSNQLRHQFKYFNEVWQQSSPATYLRALNI